MASFVEAVREKLGNAYCSVSDFSVWFAAHAANALENTPVGGLAAGQEQLYRYWNQLACGASPDAPLPPEFDSPFQGGQCPGQAYQITGNADVVTASHGTFNRGFSGASTGPIESIVGKHQNNTAFAQVVGSTGASNMSIIGLASFVTILEVNLLTINISPGNTGSTQCGNPSTAIQPSGEPLVDVTDIDYEDENGNPQTASDVTFTFGLPFLDSDGTLSVPYEVCYGGQCQSGKLNFSDIIKVIPIPPFLEDAVDDNSEKLDAIEARLDGMDERLDGLGLSLDEIMEKLEDIEEQIDEIEVFASVPEAYQIRVEAGRKQLVVMYAQKYTDGYGKEQYERNRLAQSIPHWNGSKDWGKLPIWTRGKFWAKCTLADNSRIYVLADSRSSAESVVNKLLVFVTSGMKVDAITTSGEIKGRAIESRLAYPKYARFFPQGQKTPKDSVERFEINL